TPNDDQTANGPSFFNDEVDIPGYKPELVPDSRKLREVAKAISKSTRPLLYIGGGVIHSGGSDELFGFARENRIPVVS
ncbi:acetolactate synthase large subunit, partial [Bacillus cereus]|nr:acetolactate synthase large subunit [Bacillus cereus]